MKKETHFTVERIGRHPHYPETYRNSFCGGFLSAPVDSWEQALAEAQKTADVAGGAYAVERENQQPGSSAQPVVRWQYVVRPIEVR